MYVSWTIAAHANLEVTCVTRKEIAPGVIDKDSVRLDAESYRDIVRREIILELQDARNRVVIVGRGESKRLSGMPKYCYFGRRKVRLKQICKEVIDEATVHG